MTVHSVFFTDTLANMSTFCGQFSWPLETYRGPKSSYFDVIQSESCLFYSTAIFLLLTFIF